MTIALSQPSVSVDSRAPTSPPTFRLRIQIIAEGICCQLTCFVGKPEAHDLAWKEQARQGKTEENPFLQEVKVVAEYAQGHRDGYTAITTSQVDAKVCTCCILVVSLGSGGRVWLQRRAYWPELLTWRLRAPCRHFHRSRCIVKPARKASQRIL